MINIETLCSKRKLKWVATVYYQDVVGMLYDNGKCYWNFPGDHWHMFLMARRMEHMAFKEPANFQDAAE